MPSLKEQRVIKILVVDDHPIVAQGLELLFSKEENLRVCGTADNANDALAVIPKLKPDLLIADISLKGGINGIDLIKLVKAQYPGIPILAMSMHDESLYAERAIRAGARGYIMKNEMTSTLIKAIQLVTQGRIYLSDTMSSRLLDNLVFDQTRKLGQSLDKLTDRELEVLRMIGEGNRTSDIARTLNLSVKTVDTHRTRIKKKLKLQNSAELVKYAIQWVHER